MAQFNLEKVSLLGRVIDGHTKSTNDQSIEKVRKMNEPYDVHISRQFTGITNHFRSFIPG